MKRNTLYTLLTTVMLLWIGSTSLFAQATVENVSIIEGTSNAVVTVTLPGAAPVGGTTVLYAITANTAVEGSDYTVPGDRIVIPQGSSTGTISIPIIGDATEEDLEDFSISVSTDLANDAGFNTASTFWTPLTGTNVCTPAIQAVIGTTYVFETNPETTYGGSDSSNQVLEVDCQSQGFQNITTVVGVTYDVSFKASRRTANGAGPNPSTVTVAAKEAANQAIVNGSIFASRSNTTFNFTESSFTFTATSTSTRIDFITTNNQGLGLIFDDLSIIPQTADDSATVTIVDKTPGNVGANLSLWLKADTDAAPALWQDQSGNDHDVTAVAGQQPVLETNSLNFNPVMDFDGTNDQMTNPAAPFASGVSNETNIFFVAREDARQQNSIFGFNAGTGTGNRYQAHHIYPDGTIFFDIGNPGTNDRVSGPSGLAEGVPHVASYFNSVSGNNQAIDINGANVASDTSGESQALGETRIGTANNGTFQYFNGDIAEFIAYDTDNSATNKQQIQSYLAIKYGITLNGGATAYLNSAGNPVWAVDATYANDIFGIARDDASGLNQEISKSVNNGAVLTVATNTDFTTANDGSRTDLFNQQFLMIGNDGNSGASGDAVSTDLDLTTYYERSAREWKSVNTGLITNPVSLQFDGYDDTWVLLTRTTDGNFSATTGTTETALSATGTVSIALPGDATTKATYFTLARKATSIEFEAATASADENAAVSNLPNLLIDGTLHADTDIDVVINAAGTATADTDYTIGDATGDGATTLQVIIPAATYTSGTPIPLSSLRQRLNQQNYSYPTITNGAAGQQEEPFLAPFTGDYEITFSAETFNTGGAGLVRVGTTSGVTDGSFDIFNGTGDRIDETTPLKKYTFSLTQGTTYYIYSVAGGGSTMTNVDVVLDYVPPINFAITGDAIVEADETIDLTINNAQPGLVVQEVIGGALINNHVYTITNDDSATVSIDSPTVTEGNTGTITMTFTATLTGGVQDSFTVPYALTDVSTDSDDYAAFTDANITFPANSVDGATQTIVVTINGDTEVEGDETLTMTLSAPSNTDVTLGTAAGTGTITNDDSATVSIDSPTVTEGNTGTTTLTFTATLTGGVQDSFTVPYALTDVSTDSDDYAAFTDANITFPANSADGATQTIVVTINGDTEVEGDETLTMTLSAPSNTDVTLVTGAGTGTITNDDSATVSIDSPTVTEGNTGTTTLTFTATLTGGVQDSFTVPYALTDVSTDSDDYAAFTDANITFPANSVDGATQTIVVTINGDTEVEGDETLTMTLSAPSNTDVTLGTAAGTGTITNDDSATVSIDSPTVTEGNTGTTTMTFTATLTGDVQDSFTVPYALTDVSTDSDDYAAFTDANITFPANSASGATQTIVVTINGDTEVEGDETLTMTLSAPSNTDVTLVTGAGTGTITNDDSATVSIDSPTVTEGNTGTTTMTFTATLTGGVQDSFTVPYALTDVSTDSDDYAAFTDANITFPANSASGATQTIVVTINGDTEVEGDETLTMTLSAPSNTDVTLGTAAGTGTITNDDSATVSIDSPTVTEGNTGTTTMTFTATLTGGVQDSFTVPYALTDVSTDSDDYAAFTDANITFPANSVDGATQTIVVTINGDTEVEGDETLTMTLSAPSNTDVTLGTAAGTGTITNDDSATVSIDSPTVTEGNTGTTTMTFTATLTGDVQDSFTVPYALTDVSTDSDDYAAFTDANITFPANSVDGATQTIVVTINGDTEVEGDETLTMTLSAPSNTDVTLGTAAGTGTITNDDSATVSIDSPTVTEGNTGTTTMTFTATLTGDVQDSFTVPYALTDVSTDSDDYAAFTDANITFPANSVDGATQTIVVTINGDTEVEGDETLTMTLSAPSNTDVTLGTAAGTGTITNDDSATVSIDSPTVTEGNTGTTTMTFTATLTGGVQDSFTVPYALTDVSTDSDDYAAFTDANITFPANSASGATQTIVVTINGDTEVEGDETLTMTLSAPSNTDVTLGTAAGTGTITNDDSATVSIDSPTVTEGNTGTTTMTFTATLTGGVQDSFTVPYALTDVSTDSDDYAAFTDANITFPANSVDGATQTIVVTINGDTEVEGDETLTMTLSAPSNTDVTLGTAAGTGTITNDDSATVSIDSPTVTEGNTGTTTLTFTATLTGGVQDSFTVPYALTDVSTDSDDYAAFTDANITFPANSADGATQTIVVTINGDTEVEGDETLTMTLSAPSNTDVTLGTAAGTGTITNDDSATVSIDSPTVTEGNTGTTTLTFTATLTGGVQDSFTVPYALTDVSTDSDDYAAFTDANITFPANSVDGATQTIVVTINGDTEVEGDETLTMTLSAPSNTDVTLGTAAGTGTITNDDSATVSIDSPTVTEGNTGTTTLTFTATLTGGVQDSFTVPYALTDVSTDSDDYAAFTDANITFPANSADGATQTIVVTINGDTEVEGDETLTMMLSAPSNTDVTLGTAAGTGTITNDDSATVSIDSPTVTEGNTGTTTLTFTATLTGGVQDSFTVPYALTDVSTDSDDYAAFTDANITFPANSASGATQTIVVTINGDTEVEGDETLTMMLSAPSNTDVTLGTAAGTGTITNDDSATVSIDSPTVTEGNTGTTTMTFTATLTGDVQDSFTVPYALTDVSTDSDDYAAFTDANITFPANSADGATQTIVVTINGDTEVEGDETLTMTLSAPSNTDVTLGTAAGTGTITNDDSATVSIDSPTVTEGNTGTTTLTFTATLTGGVQDSFTVPYALTDVSTDSDDYAAFTDANITFPANSADGATQTIVVTINGDTEVEGDETLTMTLSAPSTTDVTLGTAAGTGTITNDDLIDVSATGTIISALDGIAVADGTETETITVQLQDAAGNPLTGAGINVTFAVTGSAVLSSTTAVTDANGTATITITNTVAETVDVTATIDDDNDGGTTPEVAIVNGSPAQVVFTPDNTNPDPTNVNTTIDATTPVVADGMAVSTVTVTLADANGNLLTAGGAVVVITPTGSATLVSSVTDNSDGTYTATYSNIVAEDVTFSATVGGAMITTGDPTVTYTPDNTNPDPTNTNTTITATGPVPANGTDVSTVTVQLADANGNLITTGGETIVLNVSGNAVLVSGVTDNGDGTYTATFSNLLVESVIITGTLNGSAINDNASISFTLDTDPGCTINCDTDGDGDCDINCDTDGDGDCDLNCDTDGDGDCDINCDTDGDGDCDINCDTDGDGDCDINCDTDGDGDCDLNCDTDGDGDCDINCDTDGDGDCDINCDTDGDGDCDLNCDTDGDGDCDLNCDTDGDGDCDINCDTDGDGDCDINCDTDGDGDCDINCDTDGDGDCDLNCDTDGDGDCDLNCDTDGDGDCDINCDTDGDGDCDINCDTDGDGDCDINCDTDGDGDCDINCDTDGDGDPDINIDTDGDGDCDLNCDTDEDGDCDLNCDTDGDGDCDINCDTDGDGDP
ncbi:Calx-beta domain-containing protein, partial [uncultured Aquimarina sp.]|uniref:beta strand repeat-containing protein n=1 Tax=uncultured Aquimarina sp. TaxID=575652 RepID=UPI00261DC9AF